MNKKTKERIANYETAIDKQQKDIDYWMKQYYSEHDKKYKVEQENTQLKRSLREVTMAVGQYMKNYEYIATDTDKLGYQ